MRKKMKLLMIKVIIINRFDKLYKLNLCTVTLTNWNEEENVISNKLRESSHSEF